MLVTHFKRRLRNLAPGYCNSIGDNRTYTSTVGIISRMHKSWPATPSSLHNHLVSYLGSDATGSVDRSSER